MRRTFRTAGGASFASAAALGRGRHDRARTVRPSALLLAVLAVWGLTACGGSSSSLEVLIEGSARNADRSAGTCDSRRVRSGEQVRVLDGAGVVLATATVPDGELFLDRGRCEFNFTVDGLDRSDFYQVEVGGSPGPTLSHQELEDRDWFIGLGG